MKSPEHIAHGTSSEKDAEKIRREGFKAQEGRATISGDLIYSYEWATQKDRREGSKSDEEIEEAERGRILIMKVPDEKSVDYATHTNIETNETTREIAGYPSKFESGRRQLAIYDGADTEKRRERIEAAKAELKSISQELSSILSGHSIDSARIHSRDDLLEAVRPLDIKEKIEVLQKVEKLEARKVDVRKEAEPGTEIPQENILMSIVPTEKLGEKLEDLGRKIRGLETIDLEQFTQDVSEIIEEDKENFIASGLNVHEVVGNLIETTLEAEVINMMRALSVDVERARGFAVYNRGWEELSEKEVDKDRLVQKIQSIQAKAEEKDFSIGMEHLNRYIRLNTARLLQELEQD